MNEVGAQMSQKTPRLVQIPAVLWNAEENNDRGEK